MKTLKLVGARRFVCRAHGIDNPVAKNETVPVNSESAEYLLGLTYRNKANDDKPLFVEVEAEKKAATRAPRGAGKQGGNGGSRKRKATGAQA